jgi:16S rRNA (guanine(966)-N(2))-methyltransferase RsmD
MVREGLFAILGRKIEGSSFLDLYAGTGAVGIEALSRGAGEAVFVEKRPELAQIIRSNLEATHLVERANVLCSDAMRAVGRLTSQGQRFDFVFADPPYYTNVNEVLDEVHKMLGNEGNLVCQHSKRERAPSPAGLDRIDQRPFGDTILTFYRLTADPSSPPLCTQTIEEGGRNG